MKKTLILLLTLLITSSASAQVFKELYNDFLKYGTIYGAGDISNSVEERIFWGVIYNNRNII